MAVVDVHTHLWTPAEIESAARRFGSPPPFAVDDLVQHRQANGVDISLVSNTLHHAQMIEESASGSVRSASAWHEFAASLDEPGVVPLAVTVPTGGPDHLAEVVAAWSTGVFAGVTITSSYDGKHPDEEGSEDFWEFASSEDVPVYIHPPWTMCGAERLSEYRFVSSIGRPAEQLLALARLIVTGVLERHPDVRITASHLGGGICQNIGRLDYAYNHRDTLEGLGSYEPVLITKAPSEYLRNTWMDTCSFHAPAIRCAIDTIGADRLVYGSDTPPMNVLGTSSVDVVEEVGLTDADFAKVMGENAAEAFDVPAELL